MLIAAGILIFILILWFVLKKTKIDQASIPPEPAQSPQIKVEKLVSVSEALSNTRKGFFGKISNIFNTKDTINTQELDEFEEILYTSDLGPKTVQRLLKAVSEGSNNELNLETLKFKLRKELQIILEKNNSSLNFLNQDCTKKPQIWMIVGVNGAGKTTTIGKLSHQLSSKGLKVMIAAGDTFRAAAKDQLKVWADRSGVVYFSPEKVDSPSAVAFDAVKKAIVEGFDLCIVDTAGRLHTQEHLMEELKKMKRVITKNDETAPHEILLVLDANSGQNALNQARQFHESLGVSGVVLTKMDGTAKGGVAIGVVNELNIPIKLIGIGEKIEDLREFNSQEYINSIL